MYPRTWFDTYWRGTLKPEVFVVMSFADEFNSVWENAIKPAIENDLEGGGKYKAHRVDVTILSGSIVTEIFDGIAHATLIFADISMMTTEVWKGQRNGNVMYEIGLATAIRPETDMVIFKSDNEDINFDLLQIRVRKYSKDNLNEARQTFSKFLNGALEARKNAKSQITKYTWSLLDQDCLSLMLQRGDYTPFGQKSNADIAERLTIRRLLELGIIQCEHTGGCTYHYVWTDFGKAVTKNPNSSTTQV
ncbi:MAG: hypothetical protein ABSH11_13905 [Verrucomicrobiota bacterium]|jgi:hypothetical protein